MVEWFYLIPDFILVGTAIGLIIAETTYSREPTRWVLWISGLAVLASLLELFRFGIPSREVTILSGSLVIDGFSVFARTFALLLSAGTVFLGAATKELSERIKVEFFALVLVAAVLLGLIGTANNLLVLMAATQGLGLFCVLLVALAKGSPKAVEASIKLLVVQVLGFVFFTIAVALLYYKTGTFDLTELAVKLKLSPLTELEAGILFLFLLTSVLASSASFPIHFIVNDLAEGSPAPVVGFVLTALPAAAVFVLLRLVVPLFVVRDPGSSVWQSTIHYPWSEVLGWIGCITMVIRGLLALTQTTVRRLVFNLSGFSFGVILVGVSALTDAGMSFALYQMLFLLFAITGSLVFVSYFTDLIATDELSSWKGLFWSRPKESISFIIFLLALCGAPPFFTFMGQVFLLGQVFATGRSFLAVISVFATFLGWVCLGRIALTMASLPEIKAKQYEHSSIGVPRGVVLGLAMVPLFVLTFFAERGLYWMSEAIRFVLW